MASPKAMKFEQDLLEHVSRIKRLILTHVDEGSDERQQMQVEVNLMYERAHKESRQLRKALAFLHTKLEVVEVAYERESDTPLHDLYEKHLDSDGRKK